MNKKLLHPEILGIISCLIMIISVFLPWYEYSYSYGLIDYAFFGYEGDPMFLLIFAILSLFLIYIGYIKNRKSSSGLGILLTSILSIGIIISLLIRMEDLTIGQSRFASGLYVGTLGALGLFLSSIWQLGISNKWKQKTDVKQSKKNETPIKSEGEAIKTLKLRYAKGEITKEEFEEMKKDLKD